METTQSPSLTGKTSFVALKNKRFVLILSLFKNRIQHNSAVRNN
jgi:hypothetical protein